MGDIRNSAGKVAPGIDVRGTGGYVVVPPSPHPSGTTYEWAKGRSPDELTPIPAPEWLLRLVQRAPAPTLPPPTPDTPKGGEYVQAAILAECEAVATAPEGTRNDRLNAAAYALARFFETGEADPLDVARRLAYAATRAGLPEWEISRTIKSAYRGRGVAA